MYRNDNKIKAFIFDLDGVLVFTDELHYKAWKAIADKNDIYFDRNINNRLRGVSRMASLDIILEKCDREFTEEEKAIIAEEKNAIYRKSLMDMTREDVSSDVRSALDGLKNAGYKIALGSSSKNAKLILEKTDLTKYFDAISDGNNITRSKPDPEVFLKAAEFLDLDPGVCAVVEDAKAGIDAAKAAGMTAVGIGDASDYEKTDIRIDKLSDILEYIN